MEILEEVPDENTSGRGVRFNSSPFSSSVNRRTGGKDEFKALHSSLGSGDSKEYWPRKVKKYRLIPEKYREIKEDKKGPKMEF